MVVVRRIRIIIAIPLFYIGLAIIILAQLFNPRKTTFFQIMARHTRMD